MIKNEERRVTEITLSHSKKKVHFSVFNKENLMRVVKVVQYYIVKYYKKIIKKNR